MSFKWNDFKEILGNQSNINLNTAYRTVEVIKTGFPFILVLWQEPYEPKLWIKSSAMPSEKNKDENVYFYVVKFLIQKASYFIFHEGSNSEGTNLDNRNFSSLNKIQWEIIFSKRPLTEIFKSNFHLAVTYARRNLKLTFFYNFIIRSHETFPVQK